MTVNAPHGQTALTAAAARAAHLIVDGQPLIFNDHLAATLLGEKADDLISYHRLHGGHVVLAGARGQVTCRSHYAEDQLSRAARDGITQYVILGAGLDTFAHRSPLAGSLQIFEADHPATQDWKRGQLAQAGLPAPARLTYVPLDLAAGSVTSRLASSGLDPARPAFISWLGVTMYLSREAISQVPGQMSGLLTASGFAAPAHIRQRVAISPALWQRADALHPIELSVLAHATIR